MIETVAMGLKLISLHGFGFGCRGLANARLTSSNKRAHAHTQAHTHTHTHTHTANPRYEKSHSVQPHTSHLYEW
jgi:hypothetical protein